jgi:hypothetical protein
VPPLPEDGGCAHQQRMDSAKARDSPGEPGYGRSVALTQDGREEVRGPLNRIVAGHGEHVRIPADESRSLFGCQREQVVVVGVGRVNRWRGGRIAREDSGSRQSGHEGVGVRARDEGLELRVRQRSSKLSKQRGGTISSNRPSCQASMSRAGLPDREISAEIRTLTSRMARNGLWPRRTSRMLRLDAEGECVIFGEPVRGDPDGECALLANAVRTHPFQPLLRSEREGVLIAQTIDRGRALTARPPF